MKWKCRIKNKTYKINFKNNTEKDYKDYKIKYKKKNIIE